MQFLPSQPASLETLCTTEAGRDWLAARHVYLDASDFIAALRPPAQPEPRPAGIGGGAPGTDRFPVFSGHQVCCDYRWSVVAKLSTLLGLDSPNIDPVLVWLDTDRCGADKLSTSFGWAPDDGAAINLMSNSERRAESRYAVPREKMLVDAARRIEAGDSPRAAALAERLRNFAGSSLADLNLHITHLLFEDDKLDERPRHFVSALMHNGAAELGMQHTLENIDDVVHVFNDTLADLHDEGVECPVPPRPNDYLPLHWTCPKDHRRNPLHRVVHGSDCHAVAECKCGERFATILTTSRGQGLAADALPALAGAQIGPDVCAPLLFGFNFSGTVTGRSSALYGIVMNQVAKTALGLPEMPLLVPSRLHEPPASYLQVDSKLYAWMTAD